MQKLKSIKSIGKGGFGDVDLVQDEDGNEFARKTFAQNQPLDEALLENVLKRFAREVGIQSSIPHPNIVPVLDSDLDASPPFYLMPVAASTLADDIEADRTLGGDFVAAISDIVAGLEELHSMEFYHRDLKPQNVLRLVKEGTDDQFFYALGDFGLISQHESKLSVLTKAGMRKSSDYYTAPEITKELKQASKQSDIYSLGCILHDIVGTEERVPCSEIRENSEFSAILLGCTKTKPSERFKSVRDVLDAILSVGFTPESKPSDETADFLEVLENQKTPENKFWESLVVFLEHNASIDDRAAICAKLDAQHIQSLFKAKPEIGHRIAIVFAKWVARTGFSFEYCDALANRLEKFFELANFEAKVECLIALLEMGTSHNRWFVERKFFRLCCPDMDNSLAKRLGVQIRIEGKGICNKIDHLEASIGVDRDSLHPVLVKTLADVCQ